MYQQESAILFFSFIIPTFNRKQLVRRAIDSVLSSKKNESIQIEIIVIDDGSNDGTEEALQSYIDNKLITFIQNSKNSGANTSRNNGIKIANGDYCVFLDSDDVLAEDALIFMHEHFITHPDNHLFFMSSCLKSKKNLCYLTRHSDFYSLNEMTMGYVKGDFLPIVNTSTMKNYFFFDNISGFEGSIWIWLTLDGYQPFYTDKIGQIKEYLIDGLSVASQLYKRINTLASGYEKSLILFGSKLDCLHLKLYEKFCLRFFFYQKLSSKKLLPSVPIKKNKKLFIATLMLAVIPKSILLKIWDNKNKIIGV